MSLTKPFLFLVAFLITNNLSVFAESNCSLNWPKNWEVTTMPQFRDANNNSFGGERYRAILNEEGELKVGIEFTCIPVDNKKLNLDAEFQAAAKAIEVGYQKMGLQPEFSEPVRNTFNQASVIETEITVVAPDTTLKQSLMISQDSKYLYSLSYSGVESEHQNYLKVYQDVRGEWLSKR